MLSDEEKEAKFQNFQERRSVVYMLVHTYATLTKPAMCP
jgi:hypothetical protein